MLARPLCRICGCLREETEKSGYIWRYVRPDAQSLAEALDDLE
jgi:hypothetical protein